MRVVGLLLIGLAACASPPRAPEFAADVSGEVVQAMRTLVDAECPKPLDIYPTTGAWYVGWHGAIVAIADGLVAVRMEEPQWRPSPGHMILSMHDREWRTGVKGEGVVVGEVGDTLICRYFPSEFERAALELGDRGCLNHDATDALRSGWQPPERFRDVPR